VVESLPYGLLVIDGDRKIRVANPALESALGIAPGSAVGKRHGELFKCSGLILNDRPCGSDDPCASCDVLRLMSEAYSGNKRFKKRALVRTILGGQLQEVKLDLDASPLEFNGEKLLAIVVEPIAAVRDLHRSEVNEELNPMHSQDPVMIELFRNIELVGPLDVPVLIQGESGTGKELVAIALHRASPRAENLMVPVNCGAIPEDLLESELFGHVKGAFTGAVRDKKGRFELADGGTIFLDEVGELSPTLQVKFLRVLQDGSFMRIGGEKTVSTDARLICATNKDLEAEVAAGRFRADLYYRLCVVPITVPPLRDRRGDITLLAEKFLGRASEETGQEVARFSPRAIEALLEHSWPGNVRELENAVRYARIKSEGGTIEHRHLPLAVLRGASRTATPGNARRKRRLKLDANRVSKALRSTDGNRLAAARLLGVSRSTLYRFLDSSTEALD
jgi:transcriptional regulator with PAS, ATPase and Fis domain